MPKERWFVRKVPSNSWSMIEKGKNGRKQKKSNVCSILKHEKRWGNGNWNPRLKFESCQMILRKSNTDVLGKLLLFLVYNILKF